MNISFNHNETLPLLFLGHGNPMNAISENEFTQAWRETGKSLRKPNGILCISAHWETSHTLVTAMDRPRTIHDFYGFPRALYEVAYPAPGSPELAKLVQWSITKTTVGLDGDWGLDHGCWSVLKHLFPEANVPVVQLSLDQTKPPQWHFELAKELLPLRKKGILIIGSGNVVHNLPLMDWKLEDAYEWAKEANEKIKKLIDSNQSEQLINYRELGKEIQLAAPSSEHYVPLLYVLASRQEDENAVFFNDKVINGSISMLSMKIG